MPRTPKQRRHVPQREGNSQEHYTQPVRTATGQTYGKGVASADAQRAMPLPDVQREREAILKVSGAARGAAGGAGSAFGNATQGTGGAPASYLQGSRTPIEAQDCTLPNLGLSSGPSTRPHEPLTAGLAIGPGPGPSLQGGSRLTAGALLAALAAASGDGTMAELAATMDAQGF